MDELQTSKQELQIRFIVACPRSGATLLRRIFAKAPNCSVTSWLILIGKKGSDEGFSPGYSILDNPTEHRAYLSAKKLGKQFLISKEELGNDSHNGTCLFEVCPSLVAYSMVRPIVLIRDPIRVFDSWKKVGWNDTKDLIDCYSNMFRMLDQASHLVSPLLYERLIQQPHMEVTRICTRWGIPFSETMLDFKHPFESSSDRDSKVYCEEEPPESFESVEGNLSAISELPYHGLLSNQEESLIEHHVGRLYLQRWQNDLLQLSTVLAGKAWVGFDLDDTLHNFRDSSGVATKAILTTISGRYDTPLPNLENRYSQILKQKTATAFSDGKTSHDYRKERFAALLSHFCFPQSDRFLTDLLEQYEATLMESLELKCGALDLLASIKGMGKRIVIVTEGPQDAQERTVRGLGIRGYIDFLATTNFFRVSKTEGLFARVLEHLKISSDDMVYIGDSQQRDVKPATAAGIFSIHFAETEHISLDSSNTPRINTLTKLRYILSGDGPVDD